MKDDAVTLELLSQACRKILAYAEMSERDFYADEKTQSAVVMQLIVVGELAKNVSPAVQMAIESPLKNKFLRFRSMRSEYGCSD